MKLSHPVDISAVLGYIAAGGLAAFAVPLGTLFPEHGTQIVQSIALATAAASAIIRIFYNQTDAPATSVAQGAPIIPDFPNPNAPASTKKVV